MLMSTGGESFSKLAWPGADPAAGSRVVPRPYLYPKFKTKRISTTSFRKCPTLTFYLILILNILHPCS